MVAETRTTGGAYSAHSYYVEGRTNTGHAGPRGSVADGPTGARLLSATTAFCHNVAYRTYLLGVPG